MGDAKRQEWENMLEYVWSMLWERAQVEICDEHSVPLGSGRRREENGSAANGDSGFGRNVPGCVPGMLRR